MTDLPAPAATATRAIAGVLARKLITMAGTAIVAHGYLDQSTESAWAGPVEEYLIGAAVVGASTWWGILRTLWSHSRYAAAWARLKASETEK